MADEKTTAAGPPPQHFMREVVLYREKPDGTIEVDDAGKKIIERTIGNFTFKALSLRDKRDVGVLRSRYLGGMPPQSIDIDTFLLADMQAVLPRAITDAPKGYPQSPEDWESYVLDKLTEIDERVVTAIYQEYRAAVRSFRDARPEG